MILFPIDYFNESSGDLLEMANWGFLDLTTKKFEVKPEFKIGTVKIHSQKNCNNGYLCLKDVIPNSSTIGKKKLLVQTFTTRWRLL